MSTAQFDLVVIGTGPAGQKGAISAAKQGKRVAVIDKRMMLGGVCVHTGTIPSKSVREAILQIIGYAVRTLYRQGVRGDGEVTMHDLASRVNAIITRETEVIRAQLKRNGVAIFQGNARFTDPHTIEIRGEDSGQTITGDNILLACGTRPERNASIPFDGKRIVDTDQFTGLEAIPRETIVVGAGVVGLEFASFFTALGSEVTLIDQRPTILDFVDREIVDALCYHLRHSGATLRLGEKVSKVGIDERNRVYAELESGKRIVGGLLLYAVGRHANGDQLNAEAAGLQVDPRGRLAVNDRYQTSVPHVYAAGDVIGFPALASTSMEQGRVASLNMFTDRTAKVAQRFPYGIYTIPEISMVGLTEEKLTADKVPYEVGVAKYAELAKCMMLGDESGMLKLLFHRESHKLLGVHAIGERSTEIIHIGQAVLAFDGTVDYFRDTVFNYPTLAEAYKVAALDGLNKL
jgi:NAD(P) transhydrogenase